MLQTSLYTREVEKMNLFNFILIIQPGVETGNIIIILQQKEHSLYQRRGSDLFMEHTLVKLFNLYVIL